MQGVFLDRDTLDPGDMDFSPLDAALPDWRSYGNSTPAQVAERLQGVQVAISNKVTIDAATLAACPDLKLICISATGTNNVDLAAAKQQGVTVCNVRAYATPSVVQHTFALMLSLSIQLGKYRRAVMKGEWQRHPHFCMLDYPIQELAGKTLGIVGYGELGKNVARVATAFGMQVLISQRPGTTPLPRPQEVGKPKADRLPLNKLLSEVDILTLHCPLTQATENLIGAAELALMKPSALLINTARGGIVNEQALADALRDHVIAGAGIDVLTEEPPTDGNPLLADDIPNLILTPHIAWASRESRQRLLAEVAANIQAFEAGTPRNVVA